MSDKAGHSYLRNQSTDKLNQVLHILCFTTQSGLTKNALRKTLRKKTTNQTNQELHFTGLQKPVALSTSTEFQMLI